MTFATSKNIKSFVLASCATSALILSGAASAQAAEQHEFEIAPQDLGDALAEFSVQGDAEVYWLKEDVAGKKTDGVSGSYTNRQAIEKLLNDAGVEYRIDENGTLLVGEAVIQQTALREDDRDVSVFRVAQVDQQSNSGEVADASEDEREVDEEAEARQDTITVTGTNIRGIAADSSPSFTFDREDIALTGASTAAEFIRTLPQSFGGGSQQTIPSLANDRTTQSNVNFGSSVNLRGIGSGAILVLVNGRRLAPAGNLGNFTDISMIPLSAVERIEVITDGASAIYGADAIGGVVNFILRDNYVGVQTFGSVGSVTDGDMMEYRAGTTIGRTWSTGNLVASYEFFDRGALSVLDREFSASAGAPNVLFPSQETHSFLVSGSQELNDNAMLFANLTYSERRTDLLSTTITNLLVDTEADAEQFSSSIGAILSLGGEWQLDLQGGYAETSGQQKSDVTSPTTGQLTQSLARAQESSLWSVDAKLDGPLFTLPGGEIRAALGSSFRAESFVREDVAAGSIVVEDEREVISLFGEFFIPVVGETNRRSGVERLEINVAGRYEDDNAFGGAYTPKIGLLWSPLAGLNFRGSYSESFNAPDLGDTGRSGGNVIVFNVPNSSSPSGTSLSVVDLTSPNLGPEESTSVTFGVDYSKEVGSGALDLSVTWYEIEYQDRIASPGSFFGFLNDQEAFQPVIVQNPDVAFITDLTTNPDFLFFDGSGGLWTMPGDEEFYLDARLRNLAVQKTSGIDFNVNYNLDVGAGQFVYGLSGSYVFEQAQRITATAKEFDVIGTIFNPSDLRMRGQIGWSNDHWNANLFVNHVGSYTDDRNLSGVGDIPVDAWTTFDLDLAFETGDRPNGGIADNIRVAVNIRNLLDEAPPRIDGNADRDGRIRGFDPTNADALGRFVTLRVSKDW